MDKNTKCVSRLRSPQQCNTVAHRQKQIPLWPLTCDEVAKFSIEASVVVRAAELYYRAISRDILQERNIVHARIEGGRLIVYIQNWYMRKDRQKDTRTHKQMCMRTNKM